MYIQNLFNFIHNITSRKGNLAYQYLTRYDPALIDLHLTMPSNKHFFAKNNKNFNLIKMLISEHRMRICKTDKYY